MGRYIRGSIDEILSLGTLGGNTLISDIFSGTVNERTLVSSVVASWSMDQFTEGNDDGPIVVGLAHSDYTDAEIEAFVENTGSWNEGDLVAREVSGRRVRRIGTIQAAVNAAGYWVLNEGKPVKTKLNWILLQGQSLRFWAYNAGSSALATTDPTLHLQGHANLWPR